MRKSVFTPRQILPKGIVVASVRPSVRLSVRPSVRPSVCRPSVEILVCAITQQGFDLESPSSHRMCIWGPFSALLKMGSIDLDLQGHFGLKRVNFHKFELVCAITQQGFDLESPSSHRMCILGPFQCPIENGVD